MDQLLILLLGMVMLACLFHWESRKRSDSQCLRRRRQRREKFGWVNMGKYTTSPEDRLIHDPNLTDSLRKRLLKKLIPNY